MTNYLDPGSAGSFSLNATGSNIRFGTLASSPGVPPENNVVVVDPQLGPLQDNGGFAQTMAPNGPSPAGESPAIDAGVNGAVVPGVTTDQRGGNFVRIFNGTVDIGAVEVQPTPKFEAGEILNVSGAANGTAAPSSRFTHG